MAAASIANEVMVANLRKITDKQRAAPIVVAPPGGGEGWWGIRIRRRRLVLVLQSAVAILGVNVSLNILNYHSHLHEDSACLYLTNTSRSLRLSL